VPAEVVVEDEARVGFDDTNCGQLTTEEDAMARRRWSDLDERTRRLILIGAAIDGSLRVAALVDLRRRPPAEVHGSKKAWGTALAVVNSAGTLPLGYFLFGRRR
jgi:hypothetical protein